MSIVNNSTFRPRCPTCDMMVQLDGETKFLPFCSLRCRMIDLGRWLKEEHAVPCKAEDEQLEQPTQGGVQLPPGWHDA